MGTSLRKLRTHFFIIIRYLLSTQSMISRLYLGKYKAKAKVLFRRWTIPGKREHSHSGTVTVEKQQQQHKAKAKEVGLLRKGKYEKSQNSLVAHQDAFITITSEWL